MKKNEAITLIKQANFGISKLPPATNDELEEAEKEMNKTIPEELKYFYLGISNGMTFGRLDILPVLSRKNLKKNR